MQTRQKRHSSLIILAASLTVMVVSCTRDKDLTENSADTGLMTRDNGNSPAAQIEASEKLLIPASVDLPESPNGNSRVATYFAEGVQKYKAQAVAGTNPVVYQWVFVAPLADLYDVTNNFVGTHGAGPFWEISALDSIFAQHFSPARTAPSPDAGSIDWLLLKPKTGTTPTGIFADVDYIQRIATKGGKAPLTAPTRATQTVDVKYKAVYRFSKINP